jgi:hypothetical protein
MQPGAKGGNIMSMLGIILQLNVRKQVTANEMSVCRNKYTAQPHDIHYLCLCHDPLITFNCSNLK